MYSSTQEWSSFFREGKANRNTRGHSDGSDPPEGPSSSAGAASRPPRTTSSIGVQVALTGTSSTANVSVDDVKCFFSSPHPHYQPAVRCTSGDPASHPSRPGSVNYRLPGRPPSTGPGRCRAGERLESALDYHLAHGARERSETQGERSSASGESVGTTSEGLHRAESDVTKQGDSVGRSPVDGGVGGHDFSSTHSKESRIHRAGPSYSPSSSTLSFHRAGQFVNGSHTPSKPWKRSASAAAGSEALYSSTAQYLRRTSSLPTTPVLHTSPLDCFDFHSFSSNNPKDACAESAPIHSTPIDFNMDDDPPLESSRQQSAVREAIYPIEKKQRPFSASLPPSSFDERSSTVEETPHESTEKKKVKKSPARDTNEAGVSAVVRVRRIPNYVKKTLSRSTSAAMRISSPYEEPLVPAGKVKRVLMYQSGSVRKPASSPMSKREGSTGQRHGSAASASSSSLFTERKSSDEPIELRSSLTPPTKAAARTALRFSATGKTRGDPSESSSKGIESSKFTTPKQSSSAYEPSHASSGTSNEKESAVYEKMIAALETSDLRVRAKLEEGINEPKERKSGVKSPGSEKRPEEAGTVPSPLVTPSPPPMVSKDESGEASDFLSQITVSSMCSSDDEDAHENDAATPHPPEIPLKDVFIGSSSAAAHRKESSPPPDAVLSPTSQPLFAKNSPTTEPRRPSASSPVPSGAAPSDAAKQSESRTSSSSPESKMNGAASSGTLGRSIPSGYSCGMTQTTESCSSMIHPNISDHPQSPRKEGSSSPPPACKTPSNEPEDYLLRRAMLLREEGNECFHRLDYARAVRLYSQALCLDPFNSVLLCNRAAAYYGECLYTASLVDGMCALLVSPEHVKAHWRVGKSLLALHRVSEAEASYATALKLLDAQQSRSPSGTVPSAEYKCIQEERDALFHLRFYHTSMSSHRWTEALQHARSLIRVFRPVGAPKTTICFFTLLETEAQMHLDASSARQATQEWLDHNEAPGYLFYLAAKSMFYCAHDDNSTKKVLRTLDRERVCADLEDNIVQTNISDFALRAQNNSSLMVKFDEIEWTVKYRVNRLAVAEMFAHSVRKFVEYRDEGNTAYTNSDWSTAYAAYSQCAQLDPLNTSLCTTSYCNRATVLMHQNRLQEALDDCRHALNLQPKNPKAYSRRSRVYLRLFKEASEKNEAKDKLLHWLDAASGDLRTAVSMSQLTPRRDDTAFFLTQLHQVLDMREAVLKDKTVPEPSAEGPRYASESQQWTRSRSSSRPAGAAPRPTSNTRQRERPASSTPFSTGTSYTSSQPQRPKCEEWFHQGNPRPWTQHGGSAPHSSYRPSSGYSQQFPRSFSGSERRSWERRGSTRAASASAAPSAIEQHMQCLGLLGKPNLKDIGKAYREAALKWHPDKWSGCSEADRQNAEKNFKEINLSYTFLKERFS